MATTIQPVLLELDAKSWDRFQIPLPFAKCEIRFGKELHVPRESTDDQRAALKRELQERLMAITSE